MYKRILVPIDGSPTSSRGLDEALALARLTGASLRLVHVVDQWTFTAGCEAYTPDIMEMLLAGGRKILDAATARAAAGEVIATGLLSETFGGRVSDIVVDEARRWKADLIVVGTHGRRGVRRMVIGSDAEQIVRAAPVPVLLVNAAGNDIEAAPGRAAEVAQ